MTVPSHNLYDFIHQVTERKFSLFYFYPWGQKDFKNIICHQTDLQHVNGPNGLSNINAKKYLSPKLIDLNQILNFQPVLFCHDQEPLFFNYYEDNSVAMQAIDNKDKKNTEYKFTNQNLRTIMPTNWHKKWILLHSEKNSTELEKYENTGRYQGAFYWSHAMIALDWYRYAQHDTTLDTIIQNKKMFLIYARDFSGTRSYRKTFLSMLDPIKNHCQIGSVSKLTAHSDASATYDSLDLASTDISVILETLFNDQRIHLTEKTLRAIACGHPFMLAAGPGSLDFLKSYGFQTFSPWIDESYDTIQNHDQRLHAIYKEMQRLASLPLYQKANILTHCKSIAVTNKKHFFSEKFIKQVTDELVNNVNNAYSSDNYCSQHWSLRRNWRKKHNYSSTREPENKLLNSYLIPMVRHLRKNSGSLEQYQRHDHGLDDESNANGHNV